MAYYPTEFRERQRVHYRATNNSLIPATILRLCSDGKRAMLRIDGRLGEQCEPLSRCVALPNETPDAALYVIVRGSPAAAAARAHEHGVTWRRAKRDARCGQGEAAGYVPLSDIGAIVRWYLASGDEFGACVYYARVR